MSRPNLFLISYLYNPSVAYFHKSFNFKEFQGVQTYYLSDLCLLGALIKHLNKWYFTNKDMHLIIGLSVSETVNLGACVNRTVQQESLLSQSQPLIHPCQM